VFYNPKILIQESI